MNHASYMRLQNRYGGRFIAQRDGKVEASGPTYRALINSIKRKRLKRQGRISIQNMRSASITFPLEEQAK